MTNIKEACHNLLNLYSVQSSLIRTGLEYNYLLNLLRARHTELILPTEQFLGVSTSYFLELSVDGDLEKRIDSYLHQINLNMENLEKVIDALQKLWTRC